MPAAAVALAGAIALGGCAGSHHPAAAGSKAPASTAPAKPDTAAQHAIKLAASQSGAVKTLVAGLVEHSTGTSTGSATGTIEVQLKPTTLIEANFVIPSKNAKPIKLAEILTANAIYFKDPAFSSSTTKTWLKVKISQLSAKTSVSVAALLQNLEGSNPLDQSKLFTASQDVAVVGTAKVHGISTTEYAGSYAPQTAFGELTPKLRKLLGPSLRSMGTNPVHFHVWVDARHIIRKAVDVVDVRGETISTTFDIKSVNKPVKITLPNPHIVGSMPKI
jgi:hypothetical protein